MIPHGAQEMQALSTRCAVRALGVTNGWANDVWSMTGDDVSAAVAVYDAVLAGGATSDVQSLLARAGVDLDALLTDDGLGKDDITRSDLTELTAAASLIATSTCRVESAYMPNVPKMARKRSDSGIDVMFVELGRGLTGPLTDGERLDIVSVKHTVQNSVSSMRWNLQRSLSEKELSLVYVANQLRVLNGHLIREGYSQESAARAYMFLEGFPDPTRIRLHGVAFADSTLEALWNTQVSLFPTVTSGSHFLRFIAIPDISTVHEKCS